MMGSDAGYNLAPGETLVPGSVRTLGATEATEGAAPSASDEAPAAAAPAASEEAPPAPAPDAST